MRYDIVVQGLLHDLLAWLVTKDSRKWKTNKLEALLDLKSESQSVTKPVSPTSEMANMSLQEHSLAITRTITEITQKRANVSQLVAFLLCHSGSMCP